MTRRPPSAYLHPIRAITAIQREIAACHACPSVVGPPVHGPALDTRVFLLGQAPGIHEGELQRPFAWTAGKTLFSWFERELGVDETRFREVVHMAAVGRCFPGRLPGVSTDRKPSPDEIRQCRPFLEREVAALQPELLIPVGALAIQEVFAASARTRGERPRRDLKLADIVGTTHRLAWLGRELDVIALPHPSGASSWHKTEPGKTLLRRALALIGAHPAWVAAVG